MKKFLSIIVVFVFLMLLLVGCGNINFKLNRQDEFISLAFDYNSNNDQSIIDVGLSSVTVSTPYTCEPKVQSEIGINDDFADNCVNVLIDVYHSKLNKDQSALFDGIDNIKSITDITHMDEKGENINYNMAMFRQIIKIELQIPSKENVLEMIHQIEQIEGVLWAGANTYVNVNATPYCASGSLYTNQWGLNGTNGINAENAWDTTTGTTNVKIGVIDTGIAGHNDLNSNVYGGWDFVNDNGNYSDDPSGHGTHVAGIIGANGTSANGVVGVNWTTKMYALQVVSNLNPNQLETNAIYSAIVWATQNDIDIINYSAGSNTEDLGLKSLIQGFGGLFVCAAGNEDSNNDLVPVYPADYSYGQSFSNKVISVGAIKSNGARPTSADWGYNNGNPLGSNYGALKVSIFAPGDTILSTYPTSLGSNYAYMDGTSMATPFVTGVAALVLTCYPNMSAAQLKAYIVGHVRSNSNITNLCSSNGVLDAYIAIQTHTHSYGSYIYYNATTHRSNCTICGNVKSASHTFSYESISVTGGHYKKCTVCNHNFGVESHIWIREYLGGVPHGYKCKKCGLWTLNLDIPYPGLDDGIKDLFDGVETDENGIIVIPISEHVALICDNGKYGLLFECDANGKPLENVPKHIFVPGFDVDSLQKELDKKAEDTFAIRNLT